MICVNDDVFPLFLPSLSIQVVCVLVSCFYLMTLIYGGSSQNSQAVEL